MEYLMYQYAVKAEVLYVEDSHTRHLRGLGGDISDLPHTHPILAYKVA